MECVRKSRVGIVESKISYKVFLFIYQIYSAVLADQGWWICFYSKKGECSSLWLKIKYILFIYNFNRKGNFRLFK